MTIDITELNRIKTQLSEATTTLTQLETRQASSAERKEQIEGEIRELDFNPETLGDEITQLEKDLAGASSELAAEMVKLEGEVDSSG